MVGTGRVGPVKVGTTYQLPTIGQNMQKLDLNHGHVTLGTRVYYKDNGPTDTGTIIDIILSDHPFVVKWDRQMPSQFLTKDIPELGIKNFIYNPADENIDEFRGDQLCLIEN